MNFIVAIFGISFMALFCGSTSGSLVTRSARIFYVFRHMSAKKRILLNVKNVGLSIEKLFPGICSINVPSMTASSSIMYSTLRIAVSTCTCRYVATIHLPGTEASSMVITGRVVG